MSQRLIFCITSGRSGTGALARLLDIIPAVVAKHEPEPDFSHVLRETQADPAAAVRFWKERKLPALERVRQPIYVETSHLFCKGFLEPVLELGVVPDAIVLTRGARQVALSLLRLGTIPGRTEKANRYYLRPDDPGVLQVRDWHELHDYQLCYWYCLEIERRQALYRGMLEGHGARVVTTTIEHATTLTGFRQLLAGLALPSPSPLGWLKFFGRKAKPVNTKSWHEPLTLPDRMIADLEQELHQRLLAPARMGPRGAGPG